MTKETIVSKTKRFLAALGITAALTGSLAACDHIRSDGSGKDPTSEDQKKKEPVSVMPGGDRYGGSAPGSSGSGQ